jgi:signal transduction histidine kinase
MWPVTLLKNRSAKIAAVYALALILAFALLGTLTVWLTDAALHRQVDLKISAEMQRLITIEKTGGTAALAAVQTLAETNEKTLLFRFFNKQKNLLLGNFTHAPSHLGWADINTDTSGTNEQPDRFRVLTQALGEGEISVASDLDEVENIRDTLTGSFITAGLVAAILAMIGGMWFSHYNSISINQLASTAEAIAGGELKQRMSTTHGEDGFDRLSATLNKMLDRNAELLEQQRRVTSDIAHDIRTPLTRLRQILEQSANDAALTEADRLLDILSSLLRIAELEEGARHAAFAKLDLSSLASQVVDAYETNFEESGRSITLEAGTPVWVEGDKTLVLQLMSNLIENVLAHTPVGTKASLAVSSKAGGAQLSLADNGLGIAGDEVQNIFKRFYRLDKTRASQGNGLGLAVVAAIANLHGAEVKAERLDPGLKISVNWPNKKPG